MDRASTILPKVLRKRGLKDEADASLTTHRASKWLHDHGCDAVVTKLKDGALVIEVRSSVAAQECHALSSELVEYLRMESPAIRVDHVRILRV